MERRIRTKIAKINYEFNVWDTDSTPLGNLLNEKINWAYKWENSYVFNVGKDNAQVFIVDAKTKKVEWGYHTSLGFVAEELGTAITPEELRRALS